MKQQKFYKIGELANMFGITPRTIRYYEELGLLESIHRAEGDHRKYTHRAVIRLKRIFQLKDYGLALSEIQELFETSRKDSTGTSVKSQLIAIYKNKLAEAIEKKAKIESYINDLSWHIEQLEQVDNFYACPGPACKTCQWAQRCDFFEEEEA
ncbi:MAG TPA: MerR family transcriptional regulator [Spirochaetia bacterium]|nr:MerR family transcriptional regulator [Spirochaetales bacterium]HPD80692.1 MerR family transcriptional regulator [Spirochaetales bacterium]HQK34512.1 MerR family transcriptional regulator [Spirochaetales bacterium]HRS65454.1 MerR family transcriptional regulator [Spirochaetia bacterium]HRV27977.1 MerR family transcriptional regulator [Spirochaetia bacterium]